MSNHLDELQKELEMLTESYFDLADQYKKEANQETKKHLSTKITEIAKSHEAKRMEIYREGNMHTLTLSMEIELRRMV